MSDLKTCPKCGFEIVPDPETGAGGFQIDVNGGECTDFCMRCLQAFFKDNVPILELQKEEDSDGRGPEDIPAAN